MSQKIFLVIVSFLLSSNLVKAAEININSSQSIQDTINSASDGDVIVLAEGIYKESFNFAGKALTLRGSGRNTILRGSRFKAAITFNQDERPTSIVENLTFTKGLRAGSIIIDQAAPTIRNCWFFKNRSIGSGSAIFIFGNNNLNESAIITNNVFYKNKTRSFKPGNIAHTVYVRGSSPTINNNTFISNDRSGIYVSGLSAPLITSNIFAFQGQVNGKERKKIDNFGEREKRGRAIFLEDMSSGSNVRITYNLSYGQKIADIYIDGEDLSFASLETNPVSFITINNNLSSDPLFTGMTTNPRNPLRVRKLLNAGISSSSPAVNAGNPDEAFNDTDSSRNDIGATGGPTPFNFTNLQ